MAGLNLGILQCDVALLNDFSLGTPVSPHSPETCS